MNWKGLKIGLGLAVVTSIAILTGCSTTSTSSGSNYTNNNLQSKPAPRPEYHFAETRPATGKNVFIFDPQQYAWAAYNTDGQLVRHGIASGGRTYCTDIDSPCRTPSGSYQVYRKGDADCKSSIFPIGKGGAPMPYCMFFRGGFAVHGSYDVPAYNASHGCVRVTPADAAWLSQNFINIGTTVIVKPYGE